MGNPKSFSAKLLFKDGELRETAKALLREIFLEDVGGSFGVDCWVPPRGRSNPEGYRYATWNGKTIMGHRLAYELFVGSIPRGHYILHDCDNPPCANPKHLRAGTPLENTADMLRRGRYRSGMAARTHCPQGHPYDETNTKVYEGRRYCRACHKVYSREHQQRKRAKEIT